MSNPIVFYSWQSDLPNDSNRELIRRAIATAIANIQSHLPVEDSPRLEHDTVGNAGTPAISETIYHKIERSAIFVADVSFIGQRASEGGKKVKKLSNPNVLIELGYAAAKLGWDRIVLVINKHYGSPESLPFDLRNRRFPVTFELGPNSAKRTEELETLTSKLEQAIGVCVGSEYQRVEDVLSKLTSYGRSLMREQGNASHFWENESKNMVLSRMDLAINQFLDLGLVHCGEFANERGMGYAWTYLGRQCIRKLGIALPPESVHPVVVQNNVETLLFNFDDFTRDGGSRYRVDVIDAGLPLPHVALKDTAPSEESHQRRCGLRSGTAVILNDGVAVVRGRYQSVGFGLRPI